MKETSDQAFFFCKIFCEFIGDNRKTFMFQIDSDRILSGKAGSDPFSGMRQTERKITVGKKRFSVRAFFEPDLIFDKSFQRGKKLLGKKMCLYMWKKFVMTVRDRTIRTVQQIYTDFFFFQRRTGYRFS